MKPQILPLILGITLCSASAALLYVWYKTKDDVDAVEDKTVDNTDGNNIKGKNKLSDKKSQQTTTKVECTIRNDLVPLVVGRGGTNVKIIEEKTNAKIKFYEKDENNQICEVSGRLEDIEKAVEMIRQEAERTPTIKEEMYVPQVLCGKIIGRCGETLTEICKKSGANVRIGTGQGSPGGNNNNNNDTSMDRSIDARVNKIVITGTSQQVIKAKYLIEEKIQLASEQQQKQQQPQSNKQQNLQSNHQQTGIDANELKREPRGHTVKNQLQNNSQQLMMSNDLLIDSNGLNAIRLPKTEKIPPTRTTTPINVSNNNNNKPNDKIGGQLEVYVSAIASPARFWVQLVGPQSSKLDNLVKEMTEYYDDVDNQKFHKIADPCLGQIIAAMFKYDSKWYRAEIIAILPNEFNPRDVVLDLYFVDFGDSEYVQPNEVFSLRTDFLTLRFQAIECFLANVKPCENDADDDEIWDPDSISRFEELTHVAKWKKLISRFVVTKERRKGDPIRREGSPVPGVELIDPLINLNIGDRLVEEGYAIVDKSDHTSTVGLLSSSGSSSLTSSQTSLPASAAKIGSNGINNDNSYVDDDDDDKSNDNNINKVLRLDGGNTNKNNTNENTNSQLNNNSNNISNGSNTNNIKSRNFSAFVPINSQNNNNNISNGIHQSSSTTLTTINNDQRNNNHNNNNDYSSQLSSSSNPIVFDNRSITYQNNNDKFMNSMYVENSTNENFENSQIDQSQENRTNSFIDAERHQHQQQQQQNQPLTNGKLHQHFGDIANRSWNQMISEN